MKKDLDLKISGKVIIAGEHSVIRGKPALVLPVKKKYLELKYKQTNKDFKANFEGLMKEDLSLVFWGVLEKALGIVKKKHGDLKGELFLSNFIPVGTGLGASAALCVTLGRFFENLGWIQEESLYEFCRELENLFHGESSGVDIAATLKAKPIEFIRNQSITDLLMKWKPKLFISYSGKRSVTSECVNQVKKLWASNESFASLIDEDMEESVILAKRAFLLEEQEGIRLLTQALHKARSCFERWGLTMGDLDHHMKKLTDSGAIAVKPTGSGSGGFVLSLWKETPPSIKIDFIPIEF